MVCDTISFSTREINSEYKSREINNYADEQQALWRAVIVQALMDAACQSKKPEMQQYKREALIWLRGNSQDFITVCHYAGFDPECTKNLIANSLEKGCKWRAAPGKGKRAHERESTGRKPTNNR